jgi:E3 ubiquitin-protein ligase SHPRH
MVKDELTIPKQTRYLVPIELGQVERQVRPFCFDK